MNATPRVSTASPTVIVGAGHAGVQLCMALVAAGHAGDVTLVAGEAELPYHRPPLSKGFLKSLDGPLQALRPENWFADVGIRLLRGSPVASIDRTRQTVALGSGEMLPYGTLVLATGAKARPVSGVPTTLHNVVALRHAADAARLRRLLHDCSSVTIVGGGFIGLEIAATARGLDKSVQVIESAPRLLMRSVSEEVAAHVLACHRANGVDVRVGATIERWLVEGDRLASLVVDGEIRSVDLLVLGIGAEPEVKLAREADLPCDDGILVDQHLRTADPAILAIGDCARFPGSTPDARLRLESIQNATDQARAAVATISGTPMPYRPVPWFWSDQGAMRLQMVGLRSATTDAMRRDGSQSGSFSVLHFDGERLVCVESVNAPADHLASRKLLESGSSVPRSTASDASQPLKV